MNPVVTGGFTVGGGAPRNRITRITSASLNDATFAIGTGFNTGYAKACLAPNGRIYAAGNFTSYNGVTRNGIARIHDQVSPWTLTVQTGGNATETTWRAENSVDLSLLASGSNMASNSTIVYTINVPKSGCATIRFNDTGANGLQGGGWVLRDEQGSRILDNTGNGGGFTNLANSPSLCAIPLSTLQLIPAHQDKLDWNPSDVMTCAEDPLVTAQWGIGVQTDDGYEFGFFDAVGTGSQTSVFRSHADVGGISPANGQRARSLLMSSTAVYLLSGRLENVRVRSRVNGVNGQWGPVCRMQILVLSTPCVTTQLYSAGVYASCNTTRTVNAGNYVDAVPAWRFGGVYGTTLQSASLYKFKFTSGNFTRVHVSGTALPLTEDIWNSWKFLCGTNTYQVSVAVSFDGTTWCPYGPACPVTIIDNSGFCAPPGSTMAPLPENGMANVAMRDPAMTIWPNPNEGMSINLSLTDLDPRVEQAGITLFDAFGKLVHHEVIALAAGNARTELNLEKTLTAGIYLVSVTTGDEQRTERLVVQ
ncbi:MAG: T9SS type A sorting domain-containing protein [Flavobacteriales bacterium]|nr:T9SS type A sorting domain-containing protein [Flavobacteriales bacterium]